MTSGNEWFGKIKSRAKLVQETAKSQIGKITETLDKKLKEAQEDLEKQRSKAEAFEHGDQITKVWQPSKENPDGEIHQVPKTPPAVTPISPVTPELPQASPPTEEPFTVHRKKERRRGAKKNGILSPTSVALDTENDSGTEQKSLYLKERDIRKDIVLCLNELINDIVDQEIIENCLNELIDVISTVDELVENTALIVIPVKENLIIHSDNDDEIKREKEESLSSDDELETENIQTNLPNEELIPVIDIDNIPMEHFEQESIPMELSTEQSSEHSDTEDELISAPNIVESPIQHIDSKDEVSIEHSDSENEFNEENINETPIESFDQKDELPVEHIESNETHPITLEDSIKTPLNEFEDSFDDLTTPTIRKSQPPEHPSKQSPHLIALREFMSKLDDNFDVDEEILPTKQDITTIDEKVDKLSEPQDIFNNIKDPISSLQNSISDDFQEDNKSLSSQTDLFNDDRSNDTKNDTISTISTEQKFVEKKRFSIVNCQTIPPGTKIKQMICSSIYIYICTNDRKIFYAKLNNTDLPLKWQQHSDLADQLVVSGSNRTVWRLLNKHLYKSNDPIKFPPIGSQWNEIKIDNQQSLLSMSINDQYGWYIKEDGTLWLIRIDDDTCESLNVTCPFNLNRIFCFSEKVGVTTSDGEILIRVGCTNDCPEGDGWIFIQHNFGPIDDFVLLTNNNIISIVDKKHHLWVHQWTSDKGFYEVLANDDDEDFMFPQKCLISVNEDVLCFTDCEEQIRIFSDCLTGVQWTLIESNTRLQRLIGAFSDENYVWALTTDKMICSSNGQTLEKPRQAQYLTHATFVPDNSSQDTVLWSLDESCSIYVRANVGNKTQWEQVNQSQFEWNRRLVHIVCNNAGVWAVDDQGDVHFRHGHISASQYVNSDESSLLPPAWIPIPGEAKRYRCFVQIYCGPADWMVYAIDNKQTVYARIGINKDNRVGTSWKAIEDCSALELAISEHTLWLLTSCGQIQCRENISLPNPIGTRSTTLPGLFLSLTVSMDDSQVWALNSKRDLLKLDRLTVLFDK